jgi:hypothetical protein
LIEADTARKKYLFFGFVESFFQTQRVGGRKAYLASLVKTAGISGTEGSAIEDHFHGVISFEEEAAIAFLSFLLDLSVLCLGMGSGVSFVSTSRPFPLREARFATLLDSWESFFVASFIWQETPEHFGFRPKVCFGLVKGRKLKSRLNPALLLVLAHLSD